MEETVFQRIKHARKAIGLTQDQVAEATGINRSSISKIESGSLEVPTELLLFYTTTNNISADWLLTGRFPVFTASDKLQEYDKQLNQRVVEVFEVFGYANMKSGDAKFADELGITKSEWGKIIRNASPIPAHSLLKLTSKHNLSINWLLTGIGSINEQTKNGMPEPVKSKAPEQKSQMPAVVTVDSEGRDNVALVNVKARAGYLAGYGDPEFVETLPSYRLPGVSHGTFRMFEVEGSSMEPTLSHRDKVVGEWVENHEYMSDERVYIIVTRSEGIVIKRCINRINKYGYIIAKSDNANKIDYPDLEIPPFYKGEPNIVEIWYPRLHISAKLPAPSDLYNRMTNLEVEMHQLRNLLS